MAPGSGKTAAVYAPMIAAVQAQQQPKIQILSVPYIALLDYQAHAIEEIVSKFQLADGDKIKVSTINTSNAIKGLQGSGQIVVTTHNALVILLKNSGYELKS